MSDNRRKAIIFILVIGLILSIIISIGYGSVDISILDILNIFKYKLNMISHKEGLNLGSKIDIILIIRLPRIILGLIVGMGLSVSGLVMQSIVRNPLADPYILGISSGASLGASLAIFLGIGEKIGGNYIGLFAFIGAFIISLLVLTFSNLGGGSNSSKLLLSGIAFSSIATAFSNFIIYMSPSKDGIRNITYWLMGSLSGANWGTIRFIGPIIVLVVFFFFSQHRILNLMLLGDEVSITLGQDLSKYRVIYLLLISLIIGLIVFSSGVIGFVGLIIPHIVRITFGTNHRDTTIITALVGSIFLIWMDIMARTILQNSEIPIGILISLIGSPIFIYLIVKKSYGFGGE